MKGYIQWTTPGGANIITNLFRRVLYTSIGDGEWLKYIPTTILDSESYTKVKTLDESELLLELL